MNEMMHPFNGITGINSGEMSNRYEQNRRHSNARLQPLLEGKNVIGELKIKNKIVTTGERNKTPNKVFIEKVKGIHHPRKSTGSSPYTKDML